MQRVHGKREDALANTSRPPCMDAGREVFASTLSYLNRLTEMTEMTDMTEMHRVGWGGVVSGSLIVYTYPVHLMWAPMPPAGQDSGQDLGQGLGMFSAVQACEYEGARELSLSADLELEDAVTLEPLQERPVFLLPELLNSGEIAHVYSLTTLQHLKSCPFSRLPLHAGDACFVPERLWPPTVIPTVIPSIQP